MRSTISIASACLLSMLLAAPMVAQAPSLRPTSTQHEASARLYGAHDHLGRRAGERPGPSGAAKGAWIGGTVGGALGALFVLAFTSGRDGGGSPIDGNGPLFIIGGAALGALVGAALGAAGD